MAGNVSIDGLQLSFPGTGLALVCAEWIRGLAAQNTGSRFSVIIPECVDLPAFNLEHSDVRWVRIPSPAVKPDYLFRVAWGRAVWLQRERVGANGRHFIPYLYNYGELERNVVLVPDLVYRLYPDYGHRLPGAPWWSLKNRLPLRPMVRRWEECRVAQAGRLIVYSRFVRDHAREVLKVPDERFTEVPLAPPRWISDGATSSLPASTEGILPDRFAVYIGGYAARKNVPMLIRVCAEAHKADPTFRCVFVGLCDNVIEKNPDIKGALEDPHAVQAVVSLPNVENSELAALYHHSTFSVYPSCSEGFGLPVIEAGACGRLCLCGDNSSMVEIQDNPEFRIASTDEAAWVRKVLYHWQNLVATELAGQECARMSARFSWNASCAALAEVLLR